MKLTELVNEKREDILRLASQHGARNVRLFGSVGRGEAGPESDVDFLVETGPDHSPWFPGGLIADLEDLLGGGWTSLRKRPCTVTFVTEFWRRPSHCDEICKTRQHTLKRGGRLFWTDSKTQDAVARNLRTMWRVNPASVGNPEGGAPGGRLGRHKFPLYRLSRNDTCAGRRRAASAVHREA